MEGKISRLWETAHQLHLCSTGSSCLVRSWTADLITHLLELTHSLWTTRNGILHLRDEDGLKVAEGVELREAIIEQYTLGKEDLPPSDRKLLEPTLHATLGKSAKFKRAWLHSVR